MTISLDALRGFAVLSLGAGAAALLALLVRENFARLRRFLVRHHAELQRELSFLRSPFRSRRLLELQCIFTGLGLASAVWGNLVLASILVVPVFCVGPVLGTRRARRIAALESQIDVWLTSLASALRATPALGEAIEYTLSLVSGPMREELETLVKEQKLGVALDEGFVRMSERIRSRTLQMALGTLRIGQRTGGDIPKILERSAKTLREMARLEGVVRVKTAEGKAQGYMLGLLPFPLVALFRHLHPDFLTPLVALPRGRLVIAAAVICWLGSIALTRRILRVDI